MIFRRMLVPLDGSAVGEAVLGLIQPLMRASDARVDLVRVMPFPSPDPAAEAREGREYLEPIAARLRAQGVNASAEVRTGLAVEELTKHVAVNGIDLVAMTTHGRGGFRRWLMGSVAEDLLRRVSVPVLVKKAVEGPERPAGGLRHVLAAVDGSKRSEKILPHVAALAKACGAKVSVMTVVPEHAVMLPTPPVAFYPANPKPYLTGLCRGLAESGVAAEPVVAEGGVIERISAFASDAGVDLVAVATHGRGGPSRWILGSVAEFLIRTLRIPSLVLRVPEEVSHA